MRALFAFALLLLVGCAQRPPPIPEALYKRATIDDRPGIRVWGDERPDSLSAWLEWDHDKTAAVCCDIMDQEHHYLALSGGGPYAAFGAGVLRGWTRSGTRPQFTIVTGISAGALQAPFAFLGSEYDKQLEELFTTISTFDVLLPRDPVTMLSGDAAMNSRPLHDLIRQHITRDFVREIAAEHRGGRRLYVGTSHLYAERPMIWNIGLIAQEDSEESLELIHRVLLASASIPGVFSPVMFDVSVDGDTYQEMHVDGGSTSTVFLYPPELIWSELTADLRVHGKPHVYVIQNLYAEPTWEHVERKTLRIAMRAAMAGIRAQGLHDISRIYQATKRDDMVFRLMYVPSSFRDKPKRIFDREFMGKLHALGEIEGAKPDAWKSEPPGVVK